MNSEPRLQVDNITRLYAADKGCQDVSFDL